MRRFRFALENGVKLSIKPPTLRDYYKGLLVADSDEQLFAAVAAICGRNDENIPVNADFIIDNFSTDDLSRFMTELPAWVKSERKADPNS